MVDSLTHVELTAERRRPLRRRLRRRVRLGRHVAALAVVLIALLPLMAPRSATTSDDGAYALQVKALQDGSWRYDYQAASIDPRGDYVPLANVQRAGGNYFPYIQHPAYARLMQGAVAALGETVGLHVWPLVGVIGLAIAAWLLAGEVDPRLRTPAFWLAATGPALVNGYSLWAHTLSAAVAGLSLVAAVRIAKRGATVARCAALASGLVAGVLLRSEGLLFAGAVVVVLAVTARSGRLLLLGCAPVAAALGERIWVRAIAGGAYDTLRSRGSGAGFLAGRVGAAWHDLFEASALGVVGLVLVVGFGLIALRRWDPKSSPCSLAAAVALGAALAVVQFVRAPSDLVTGLFAACPLLLLGLLLAPRLPVLTPTVGLFALAVVATEYPGGGGAEWGGRFFFPLLAPLTVLAVSGIDRRLRTAATPAAPSPEPVTGGRAPARPTVTGSAGRARGAGAALIALAVASTALSVLTVAHIRSDHAHHVAAVRRYAATTQVTVTTATALPNVAWSTAQDVTWMATTPNGLQDLLSSLRAQGVATVTVIAEPWTTPATLAPYPHADRRLEPSLEKVGLAVFSLRL